MKRTLPPELERIIGRALEKEREARYPSAIDMLADLRRVRDGAGSGRRAAMRLIWTAVVAMVVLLAALAGWLYLRSDQTIH
ncbi:MAG: hypothetical protein IPJ98_18840, partial [Bryobacterales bacterium]|nr:hypothetical protein [Bryobacterales bacterium]